MSMVDTAHNLEGIAPYLLVQATASRIPLPDRSVHAIITSPPFFRLRRYLDPNDPLSELEIGSEQNVTAYVQNMIAVCYELHRILRDDGVLWLELGDCYTNGGR